jgi:phospholipid transport system substrate-binding protein
LTLRSEAPFDTQLNRSNYSYRRERNGNQMTDDPYVSLARISHSAGVRSVTGHSPRIAAAVALARVATIILVVMAGALLTPRFAAAGEDPADFIRILGNQGLAVIRSGATLDQKAAYFRHMLHQDFDITDISRFVLGRYWRVATKAQRREFCSLFETHPVRFYGQRFAQYGGESLTVNGSAADPAGVVVTSQLVRPQGPPIAVDRRLVVSDGRYKIGDIGTDGVSMALTQRSEFATILQRNGGGMAGLFATMEAI